MKTIVVKTTNSVVAILKNGQPVVIQSSEGSRLIPSVVSISPAGERFVGADAVKQSLMFPGMTAASFKRNMGSRKQVNLGNEHMLPEELSAGLMLR